jgi:chromosome partitioning protein
MSSMIAVILGAECNVVNEVRKLIMDTCGADLFQAGELATATVTHLRERRQDEAANDGGPAALRRFSMRELGAFLGVAHSTISRSMPEEDRQTEGAGRLYRYSFRHLIEARERHGRTKYRPEGEKRVRVAINNLKGGVSKSTLCTHLAVRLVLSGYRVLVLDLDPQATASTQLGLMPDYGIDEDETLIPFLDGKFSEEAGGGPCTSMHYAIKHTDIPNLDAIPASMALAGADMVVPARQMRDRDKGYRYWRALDEGLRAVEDEYDVVLMDCPPSLSFLAAMAARAATCLLVPLRSSMPDFASSAQFHKMFGRLNEDLDYREAEDQAVSRGVELDELTDEELDAHTKRWAWSKMVITQKKAQAAEEQMEHFIRGAYPNRVLTNRFMHSPAVQAAGNCMRTLYDISRQRLDSRQLDKAVTSLDLLCEEITGLIESARMWVNQQLLSEEA